MERSSVVQRLDFSSSFFVESKVRPRYVYMERNGLARLHGSRIFGDTVAGSSKRVPRSLMKRVGGGPGGRAACRRHFGNFGRTNYFDEVCRWLRGLCKTEPTLASLLLSVSCMNLMLFSCAPFIDLTQRSQLGTLS